LTEKAPTDNLKEVIAPMHPHLGTVGETREVPLHGLFFGGWGGRNRRHGTDRQKNDATRCGR
jgi:hypothetical protein